MKFVNLRKHIKDLLICLIVLIISFPDFGPDYGTGLDASYRWAFNELFHSAYPMLVRISHPFGPLAFLKIPATIGSNLGIALIFHIILFTTFFFMFLSLAEKAGKRGVPAAFLMVLLISYFTIVDSALIGITAMSLINFHRNGRYGSYLMAAVAATAGMFIKLSIGLCSFLAIITYLGILLSRDRDIRKSAFLAGLAILVYMVSGLIVFRGFSNLFSFSAGILHLSGGYSSGMALFPANNRILLGIFLALVLSYPFFLKEKPARFTYLILLLPLFGVWKHAMVRQDIYHSAVLLNFLVVFFGIILATVRKPGLTTLLIPVFCVVLFYANMANLSGYEGYRKEISGANHFARAVFRYNAYKANYDEISRERIREDILPADILGEIGTASVDVYPWELSYIPANNLNWRPRKNLEIGAGYSGAISAAGSKHYGRYADAPEFVIFHLEENNRGEKFSSLDGRYILNDEPRAIFNLLRNYDLVRKNDRILLFQRSPAEKLMDPESIKSEMTGWDEWIDVPNTRDGGVQRLRFRNRPTLPGRIKEFLYKGEAFYIDYMLANGRILSYRFIASTASQGLWVNPLITAPQTDNLEPRVEKIRFRTTGRFMRKKNIRIEWEEIKLYPSPGEASALFGKNRNNRETVLLESINDFEQDETAGWRQDSTWFRSDQSYSGQRSYYIPPGGFSATFETELDSIWNDSIAGIRIEADAWYLSGSGEGLLVMGLEKEGEMLFWDAARLEPRNSGSWEFATLGRNIDRNEFPGGSLGVYIWNPGKKEGIRADRFSIRILKNPSPHS